MAQATCVKKASDTLQIWESKGGKQHLLSMWWSHCASTRWRKKLAAANPCWMQLMEMEPLGSCVWGYPHKPPEQALEQPCLAMELQHGVQHPGLAGRGPRFSGAFWFCEGMREHCRTDVGTWKSQGDTVFYKAACVWIENLHNMDACQSGNILELVGRAASLCDLFLSSMSGLKLGEVQTFKSKLKGFLLYCHLVCQKGGAVAGELWV